MEWLMQQQASQAVAAGSDPAFLRFLANDYSKAGRREAALLCLNKVVQLQASDGGAWQAIGALKAQQGEWLEAAAAHSSAAQHMPAGAARAEVLLAAATAYLNAASGRGEEKVCVPGCCLPLEWAWSMHVCTPHLATSPLGNAACQHVLLCCWAAVLLCCCAAGPADVRRLPALPSCSQLCMGMI
jgi:hypothetical protein